MYYVLDNVSWKKSHFVICCKFVMPAPVCVKRTNYKTHMFLNILSVR